MRSSSAAHRPESRRSTERWLAVLLLGISLSLGAQTQNEPPNGVLLVAKPGMVDPNFSETVVLVSQTPDGSTVGVILNRPTPRKHEKTGDPLGFGGPVMREVLVALYRSERQPQAAAFHVLKGVYLTMHPQNIEPLLGNTRGTLPTCSWASPAGRRDSSKASSRATAGSCSRRARKLYFARTRAACGKSS